MSTHYSSAQKTTELDSDVRQHVQELFPEDHYGRVKSVSSPSFRGRNKSWVLTFVFLAQYSVMGWGVDTLLDVHRIDSLCWTRLPYRGCARNRSRIKIAKLWVTRFLG